MSEIATNIDFLENGNGNNNGTPKSGKQIHSQKEWCWDDEDPKFNLCGKSANLKVTAIMNETDTRIGDSRIRITAIPTFTPTLNVVSDITTYAYDEPNGNFVTATGTIVNSVLDLYGNQINDLASNGITKVDVTNAGGNKKRIRISGTLTLNDIDTAGGTFFMLRKNLAVTGLQFNPKEIVFYSEAISNIKQGANYVEFDYDMAYTAPNKLFMFWITQTVYKLNNAFFKGGTVYEQKVRVNLEPLQSPITFTRTITFSNTCAPKIIKKRVSVLNAIYPFINLAGLVNTPVTLQIQNL